MNKDQTLGQIRALLTASGSALATWGITDGNAWAPITGALLAIISATWGVLHHKDPARPGVIKWSLVRKAVNAIGTAAITYGLINPEKVDGAEMVLASLAPFAAMAFSWIDNDSDDGDKGPDGINLLLLVSFLAFLIPSCADFPIVARLETEYGTVETDSKGGVVIRPIPRVIRIPLNEK
jgi:hypothetical protein